MITVIKNINVYAPEPLGKKNVVIVCDKFEGIYDELNIPEDFIDINIIDGAGKIMFPGLIDCHVHLIGGGGEGGFSTRTPELMLSELTTAGITTVVGCLGTDNVCRNMTTLIAKVKALKEEGITAYCYTGSYEVPVKTATGTIKQDLMLIDEVIGVGEIALSDHRSSQPTFNQFVNTVAEARCGGILSGKGGVVNIHLGGGSRRLDMVFSLIEDTEIPPEQLLPTHINRSTELFAMGIDYIKKGGFIDFTTSSNPNFLEPGELRASEGLKKIYDMGLPIDHVTFTSDGNGSMPLFNGERKLVGLGICSVKSLYEEVKNSVLSYKVPIKEAIKVVTSNVADLLKLKQKGRIEKYKDADFILVDEKSLDITDVCAKGRMLVKDNKVLVKGTFE